jgi:hypothetical protein
MAPLISSSTMFISLTQSIYTPLASLTFLLISCLLDLLNIPGPALGFLFDCSGEWGNPEKLVSNARLTTAFTDMFKSAVSYSVFTKTHNVTSSPRVHAHKHHVLHSRHSCTARHTHVAGVFYSSWILKMVWKQCCTGFDHNKSGSLLHIKQFS